HESEQKENVLLQPTTASRALKFCQFFDVFDYFLIANPRAWGLYQCPVNANICMTKGVWSEIDESLVCPPDCPVAVRVVYPVAIRTVRQYVSLNGKNYGSYRRCASRSQRDCDVHRYQSNQDRSLSRRRRVPSSAARSGRLSRPVQCAGI